MSNVLRVVVEDVESPVVPDTGGEVTPSANGAPYTGSFSVLDTSSTSGINFASLLPFSIFGFVLLFILAVFMIRFRRSKKPNFKIKVTAKRIMCFGIVLTSISGLLGFFVNTNLKNYDVNAAGETLNITSQDTTINIIRETEVNYATARVEVTLNEPTAAGYDFYIYAPNGNMLEPESDAQAEVISSVESVNSMLSGNTYGVGVSDEAMGEVWNPISESESAPMMIVSSNEATTIGDKIIFYYGVLVNQDLPAGTYTTEVEYKAIPHYYTITLDPNEGMLDDTTRSIVAGTAIGDLPTPTRTNYVFDGWYTNPANGEEITSTTVPTQTTTYYAHWAPSTITFTAGDNIETIIIASASSNYKPLYASSGHPVTISEDYDAGTKYIITVIPEAGYKLGSWIGDTGGLVSTSLLTTSYTTPDSGIINLTAVGQHGSYASMQSLNNADCAASGINVTDARDNKSYAVAKIDGYCFMLSNLRLDNIDSNNATRILTSSDSDITTGATFTMPTETWRNQSQDYYCRAIMASSGHEYYYNWYAAKANPYLCDNPTDFQYANETNDAKSLGSICPAGWTLPDYVNDIAPSSLWDNGSNPGALLISGTFKSGAQNATNSYNGWWSSERYDNYMALDIYINGANAIGSGDSKTKGLAIRCLLNL